MIIKYLDKNPKNGIVYDWKHIRKEYKKLKCPDYVFNPCVLPLEQVAYNVLLSERSTGKTTNILLLGMICNREYGTVIQYIRSNDDMIANKVLNELFKTIRVCKYIYKLTNGVWNDCIYKARKWYYCNIDEDGNILNVSPEHFMYCLSIDKSETYKSSYNAPTGDFIIFDEFISKRYRFNEFVYFMDLLKTIIRDRQTAKIFMIANTIDKHSEYFSELEIYDNIQMLEYGNNEIVTTPLGTKIYIEIIADKKDLREKMKLNQTFFGFLNPKLNSIVGGEWATNNFPHIEKGYTTILQGVYIEYHDKLLALDFVTYPEKGLYLNVHKATRTYEDSIIYSIKEPKDKRYRFYMGKGDKLDQLIKSCIDNHKVFFQNNSCGTIFFNHVTQKIPKGGY